MNSDSSSLVFLTQPWEAWAKTYPQQKAVIDLIHKQEWSYENLANQAHFLAHQWQAFQLPFGSRIALTLDASGTWIAAIWAAWMLGWVWAPIPPQTPSLRAQHQLDLFDPALIFDGQQTHLQTPKLPPCHPDAAYLFFTSGSTGTPKGVLVGKQGLTPLWQAQIQAFEVQHDSRTTWMLSPAFDASLSDIGVALTAGATLIISSAQHWKQVKTWKEDVERHQISHIDIPPSLLAIWSKHHQRVFPKGLPSCLKTLIVGGEASPQYSIDFWSNQVRWVNVYGPTEATVCTSLNLLKPGMGEASLGQPLSGIFYKVLPLDSDNPDVEEVNEGELWIGGEAVALEYWQNPLLTKERFFKDNQGQKWFKTGDFVEKKSKQEWIWQGRIDRQIKRHGQLLHLDEVEQTFYRLPSVNQAVVFLDEQDDLIVALPEHLQSHKAHLESQIQLLLPKWGQPQHWWFTGMFPKTLSGKINRKELQTQWQKKRKP